MQGARRAKTETEARLSRFMGCLLRFFRLHGRGFQNAPGWGTNALLVGSAGTTGGGSATCPFFNPYASDSRSPQKVTRSHASRSLSSSTVHTRQYSAKLTRRRRERSDRRAVLGVLRPSAMLLVRYSSATILFTMSPIANLTLLTDS